ncbi:hypothetical protein [Methylobacterium sp. NEAU K]|uniref:hypothetical protein n=1 Tax=Methylobacterium sp. NEAU K TaxID=3064946 RepID=UPI00273347CC|nr:hypothetical protein [Methylobacterium sp. NEAU K]MDP4005913.1 hypothetical protein [Methylobacterium sp. NEAU K]
MVSGPATPNQTDLRSRASTLRAAVAVLALYAFLLVFFLGGLTPMAAAVDGLCTGHAQADEGPGKAIPHDYADCCTAAQAAGAALPARTAPEPVAWPLVGGIRTVGSAAETPRARAPPGRIAPPRGPPAA